MVPSARAYGRVRCTNCRTTYQRPEGNLARYRCTRCGHMLEPVPLVATGKAAVAAKQRQAFGLIAGAAAGLAIGGPGGAIVGGLLGLVAGGGKK